MRKFPGYLPALILTMLLAGSFPPAGAEDAKGNAPRDWPLFGGTPGRNMVNLADKNVPTEWSVEEGKLEKVRWVAELGNKAYGGPVISGGRVFVGTNNATPRDPKVKGPKAVLMCFSEKDGKFLWQNPHDIPPDDIFKEAVPQGLCSTPAVDGDRVYYVTPACEVVCADTATGKVAWQLDMMKELKVVPYHLANCSPLVVGDLVYVVTSNGVNEEGKVASPKAPSFLALNKKDGKIAWQSDLPGDNIIEGQWSNPTYAEVNGKGQVIFPGGDAWLYSFEPKTGKLIWKFNCNPKKDDKKEERVITNYMVATPVAHGDRLYIGLGLYPEHPSATRFSYFFCIDLTRTGDVSPANGNFDARAPENKNSALVWSFGGAIEPRPKKGRPVLFGRTMSTAAVHDGLAYVAEENGYLHCLDAKTGKRYWEHDFRSGVWGSPYWVDNKVYIGVEDGEVVIFEHGRSPKVLAKVNMDESLQSTPVVANGVLYVQTKSKLYAIGQK